MKKHNMDEQYTYEIHMSKIRLIKINKHVIYTSWVKYKSINIYVEYQC